MIFRLCFSFLLKQKSIASNPFYFCFKIILMNLLTLDRRSFSKVGLIITFLFLFIYPSIAQNRLTIEDIWSRYAFIGNPVEGFSSLPDGEHYSAVEEDERGRMNIFIYSYQTGKISDTIAKEKNLIPADSVKPIHPEEYKLSKDGSKVLFKTASEKIYRRSSKSSYFIYDRKTGKLISLSAGGKQKNADFSPDGSKVAFVRDNNLFYNDLEAGKEVQVTDDGKRNFIINGLTDWVYEEEFEFTQAFQWSPDSKHLAYYRFDETLVPDYTIQFFTGLYPENYTYKYPKVGEKNSIVNVYIYDLDSRQKVIADVGSDTNQYIPRIKWTNDPNRLCVFRMNRWQNKLELLLADAATGKSTIMFTEENKRYINIHDNLRFFNGNKNFTWTSQMDGFNHIYIGNVSDGKLVQVTKGNWDVMEFYGIDEKNKKIYYQSAEVSPTERYVYEISMDGTNKKQITTARGWNDAEFNSSYNYVLITHSDANHPEDFKLYKVKGQLLRVLEENDQLNEKLKPYPLSKKEFFTFTTSEGVQLNGWMIKPWNFDEHKKYPVFMTQYGGPASQQVINKWGGLEFMVHEYLAQEGYVIVCVDNRGTGARGEEFEKMTYLRLGKFESTDQIEAARYLETLSFIDKDRICIFGWSYGGYLSALCIELGSDVFKAAISVAPVTDWRFYDTIYTERYMRDNKENQRGYVDGSPVTYAARIKGKYLVVAGLADDNVHYQNTAVFLKKLYENNVKFDQLTFPDKNHSIYGGNTRFYLYSRITEWLKTNL